MKTIIKVTWMLLVLTLFAGLFAGCQGAPESVSREIIVPENIALPLADSNTISMPVASGKTVIQNGKMLFDVSNANDGYVMIKYLENNKSADLVVVITGPDSVKQQYKLKADGTYETFPLSGGNGKYNIKAAKNVPGKGYVVQQSYDLEIKLTDELKPFLIPNQYVNYTENSKVVKTASELCKGIDKNLEKVAAIYDYVVDNFNYNYDFAKEVKEGKIPWYYLPDVDKILESKTGICFDYAAVMAAMLRSQGVPCKLVIGLAGDLNHAWINVWSESEGWLEKIIFFDGKAWTLMDPTFASTANDKNASSSFVGKGNSYKAQRLY